MNADVKQMLSFCESVIVILKGSSSIFTHEHPTPDRTERIMEL